MQYVLALQHHVLQSTTILLACAALHYPALHCKDNVQCNALQYTELYNTLLYCTLQHCSALYYTITTVNKLWSGLIWCVLVSQQGNIQCTQYSILCTADHSLYHATPQLCTVLYDTWSALHWTVLHQTVPLGWPNTTQHNTALHNNTHCTAQQYIALHIQQQYSISTASTACCEYCIRNCWR